MQGQNAAYISFILNHQKWYTIRAAEKFNISSIKHTSLIWCYPYSKDFIFIENDAGPTSFFIDAHSGNLHPVCIDLLNAFRFKEFFRTYLIFAFWINRISFLSWCSSLFPYRLPCTQPANTHKSPSTTKVLNFIFFEIIYFKNGALSCLR